MREIPALETMEEGASLGENGAGELHLELWYLLTSAAALLLVCFYAVYMSVHLLALSYAWRWLHSKTAELTQQKLTGVEFAPGVSIIKPIIGCDPHLKTNLESFFQLKYPKYEILMCVAEMGEVPSLQVVHDLLSQYPHVPVRILQGEASIGVNPKINNMIAAYRAAQYNLIWISDISILTTPHTLSELVSHISPNHIALVHQLPFTTGVKSFADCLDKVYFGTQHSRVYLVANVLGQNCANGMSWLLKRSCLEEVGGLAAFSEYLAEDFFIGKALWSGGWRFVLSTLPAFQNPSHRSLTSYQSRIIRWGRLRATMMPWPGLVEPFTECFGLGLLGALCLHRLLHIHPLLFLLVHTSVWFTFDLVLLKLIENGPLPQLWQVGVAWCLRELWTFPLFMGGVWSREILWKGGRFRLKFGGKAVKLD
ncbi:Ceramide glucosyltransferase [Geodia barretti]|uniref:ceramide glucosyltransferase n=1 Tax=Geodia barretti TaxID=519541 RepID=A0AA35R819_GEOBA|nr:Ceramide glucosyltransferase [Geodia barretti]